MAKDFNFTKKDVMDERFSDQIDKKKDKALYYAKTAFEQYGNSIRDNSLEDWVEIGREFEEEL